MKYLQKSTWNILFSKARCMITEDNEEMNNELFENVLSLSDIKIRECLIPRKEIESIDISASLKK